MTPTGVPFLRLRKPQSPRLSPMLRWRQLRFEKTLTLYKDFAEEGLREAEEEDRWEALLAQQARDEAADVVARRLAQDGSRSYATTIRDLVGELKNRLTRQREDNFARARALMKIVEEEEAFAAIEQHSSPLGDGT